MTLLGGHIPVVRMARMAGQFAKYVRHAPLFYFFAYSNDQNRPRSSMTEIVDGKEIPSFRGDNINGFDPVDRTPDPARLVRYIQPAFRIFN